MIGFVNGTFDLCHTGHILLFQECKKYCDYLIVGLCVDPSKEWPNKNKPVETVYERLVRLESCRYVDKVVVYDTLHDLNAWINSLVALYSPDLVRFMDESYRHKTYESKHFSVREHFVTRNHNFSSTNLRERLYARTNPTPTIAGTGGAEAGEENGNDGRAGQTE